MSPRSRTLLNLPAEAEFGTSTGDFRVCHRRKLYFLSTKLPVTSFPSILTIRIGVMIYHTWHQRIFIQNIVGRNGTCHSFFRQPDSKRLSALVTQNFLVTDLFPEEIFTAELAWLLDERGITNSTEGARVVPKFGWSLSHKRANTEELSEEHGWNENTWCHKMSETKVVEMSPASPSMQGLRCKIIFK